MKRIIVLIVLLLSIQGCSVLTPTPRPSTTPYTWSTPINPYQNQYQTPYQYVYRTATVPAAYPTATNFDYRTAIAPKVRPTNVPIPDVGYDFAGYEIVDCSDYLTPADYTDKDCVWVDQDWNALSIVYYKGSQIKAIDFLMDINSPRSVHEKWGFLIGYVGIQANWNRTDITNAVNSLPYNEPPYIQQFGEIIVAMDIINNGQVLSVLFTQQ